MAEAEPARRRVDELLRGQDHAGEDGVVGALDRLCLTVSEDLALLGAAATLMPDLGSNTISASTDVARLLEDAQFGVGEGPTLEAFVGRRPVLVSDLREVGARRWPGWVPTALDAGVRAAYALPLHVGATIFGTLTLYVGDGPGLTGRRLETALVFADVATQLLLDRSTATPGPRLAPDLEAALDTHAHVFQAQGMVMVALGISLPEALARMRAHAWATGQDLTALAGDIVAGRVVLPGDDA